MHKNLLYLFLCLLTACSEKEKKSPSVFFAGEIVNPTGNQVVLYKGDAAIDSALLDEHNRFSFSFDTIGQGLYYFTHGREEQYVYLEQGDSLMIRLNTTDFDESLIFSGKGEDINNFLLELFLAKEEEEPMVNSYYGLEANAFRSKIDSLKESKFELLRDLQSESVISEHEQTIAMASIGYSYNTFKDKYPFKHKRVSHEGKMEELPEDFYDYRKEIDFNNKELTYLRPYYSFMVNHIQNLSFMDCSLDCKVESSAIKSQLHFNEHKLHLIDSLVGEKDLKDNLFRYTAYNYLLQVRDSEENTRKFIDEFHQMSKNNRHIKEIDGLYNGILGIQPDKMIPDVSVTDSVGHAVSLRDIAKGRKTVFYFWSGTDRRHFEDINRQVLKLSKERPEYHFVGISIKTSETLWKQLVEISKLNKENQYWVGDFDQFTNALVINKPNKCIITDDTLIVDAFSDIYTSF